MRSVKLTFPVFDPDLVEEIETYLDQHYQCEVIDTIPYKPVDGVVLRARGLAPDGRNNLNTRNENNYSRPMIQVLDDNSHGNLLASHKARAHGTCQCYRFDQSWNCPEHPEVPWDPEWRQFVPPTDPRHPQAADDRSVLSAFTAMYERIVQANSDLDRLAFSNLQPNFRNDPPPQPVHLQLHVRNAVQPEMDRLRDRLLFLEDSSITVDVQFEWISTADQQHIAVREHHDSEDRVVLRYIQEDDRGDR